MNKSLAITCPIPPFSTHQAVPGYGGGSNPISILFCHRRDEFTQCNHCRQYQYAEPHHCAEYLTLFADRAHYRQRTWTLNDIVRSEFLSEQITTARLQEASWDSTLNPGVINSVMIDPDKLSTRELYDTIDFLQKNELEAGRYQLAFCTLGIVAPNQVG